MPILTKGTQLFFITGPTTVQKVDFATSVSGISAPADQVEKTDLEDTSRRFDPGLLTPGAATFALKFTPGNASHVALFNLYATGAQDVRFALGWGDGTAPPTAVAGEFVLPATRSWLTWTGYVQDLPFDFAINAHVETSASLQISGVPVLTPKV